MSRKLNSTAAGYTELLLNLIILCIPPCHVTTISNMGISKYGVEVTIFDKFHHNIINICVFL